ncbi:MAG TPA: response regulator transcription factor [Longimicrobiales bacterium]|nr:response regulator transcription factor [Longimicrobiales bacterium]
MDERAAGETEAATVPPNDEITVALIEDNRLVREGLTSLLNRVPDIRVIAGAGSPGSFPADVHPRVILLDLGLEDGESLRVAQKIGEDFPDAGVIVMDLLPAEEDIMEFVGVGVSGFVMKDATLDELLSTIRSVASGTDVLPPPLVGTLFSEIAKEVVSNGVPAVLDSVRMTPREREVIDLIAEGLSNKAIGKELHISTHTVKSHLRNIMEKLNLHSRLQIAVYVHEQETGR